MTSKRNGVVQFCDDIRQEIGNKYSLMGCYADDFITDCIPTVLPKLCAQVKLFSSPNQPFSKLVFRATMRDASIAEIEVPDPHNVAPSVHADGEPLRRISYVAMFVFSPLPVAEPGRIKIDVETEDGIFEIGSLLIRQRAEGELLFPWDQTNSGPNAPKP